MPLLTSPIDGSPMRQINRYGIEIDLCPTSGGVWLDKGEIDKIIHLLREDIASEKSHTRTSKYDHSYEQKHNRDHDDDWDDDRRNYEKNGYYGSGKHHKKEGKMSRFMDLFDF
jgi:uncharacterized protein